MTSQLKSHITIDDLKKMEEVTFTYPSPKEEYYYDPKNFTQYEHEVYTIEKDRVILEYNVSIFKKDRYLRDVDTAYDSDTVETDKISFEYAVRNINKAIDSAKKRKNYTLEVIWKDESLKSHIKPRISQIKKSSRKSCKKLVCPEKMF